MNCCRGGRGFYFMYETQLAHHFVAMSGGGGALQEQRKAGVFVCSFSGSEHRFSQQP